MLAILYYIQRTYLSQYSTFTCTILNVYILQVISNADPRLMYKLTNYLKLGQFHSEIAGIIFYFVGTILACFAQDIHTIESKTDWRAEWGRIFVVVSLVCFYMRLLNIFAMSRALGPKILIIWKMWGDMRVVLLILIVLMVAFAVSFHALVASHKGPEFSFYELRDIVAKSWWPLFGEFSTDLTKNLLQDCTSNASYAHSNVSNATEEYCPMTWRAFSALGLQGFFVMVTSLLFFNLLIAMFKYAVLTLYSTVQRYTVRVWLYTSTSDSYTVVCTVRTLYASILLLVHPFLLEVLYV